MFPVRKGLFFIIIFNLIISLFLSWPLALHLEGFLLTSHYQDIFHADTLQHLSHLRLARILWQKGGTPLIISSADVAQTYVFSGLVLTKLLPISDVAFHNLYFILTIFLSGLTMFFLAKELFSDEMSALLSGFLYMSSNYLFQQYVWGHTNIMQIQWLPLIFLFLQRILEKRDYQNIVLLGLVLALQVYSSSQYTVYLSLVIPIYLLFQHLFVNKKLFCQKGLKKRLLMALFVAFCLSFPFLIKRSRIIPTLRTIQENLKPSWRLVSFNQLVDSDADLNLGLIQVGLVLAAIVIIFLKRRDKKYRRFFPFAIFLPLFILLMLGPVSSWAPYYWLIKLWPLFDRFRVPKRFFPFALLCTSLLSPLSFYFFKKINISFLWRFFLLVLVITLIVFTQLFKSSWLSGHHIFYYR